MKNKLWDDIVAKARENGFDADAKIKMEKEVPIELLDAVRDQYGHLWVDQSIDTMEILLKHLTKEDVSPDELIKFMTAVMGAQFMLGYYKGMQEVAKVSKEAMLSAMSKAKN